MKICILNYSDDIRKKLEDVFPGIYITDNIKEKCDFYVEVYDYDEFVILLKEIAPRYMQEYVD